MEVEEWRVGGTRGTRGCDSPCWQRTQGDMLVESDGLEERLRRSARPGIVRRMIGSAADTRGKEG